MVDLREKLMIYMRSMGATEKTQSTKKHFRKKLEKEFGDLLQFEDLLNNNKRFSSFQKSFLRFHWPNSNVISAIRQGDRLHLKSRKYNKLACTSVMHFFQIIPKRNGQQNHLNCVRPGLNVAFYMRRIELPN